MTSFQVEDLSPDNEKDWESLVEGSTQGSFFHTLRWKRVVERSFGYRSRYFLVYEDENPVALCPLFESSIKRWGALVSLPVGDIEHLIMPTPLNQEVSRLILKKSIEVAKESRLSYVILYNRSKEARDSILATCPLVSKKAVEYPAPKVPILDLEEHSPQDIWDNVFNSKKSQRKYINRFEQAGFEIKETRSKEDLDTFYKYYLDNVNFIQGKPVDRSHIDNIFEEYSHDGVRLTLLQKDGEVAGGLFCFLYPPQKTMYLRHMALNRSLPSTYHPPYALFWEAVNYAYDHGYKRVCFGSTSADPDVRSHQIKMGFGCDYMESYGELIGMNPVAMTIYRAYMWSREARNQDSS